MGKVRDCYVAHFSKAYKIIENIHGLSDTPFQGNVTNI